MGSFFPKKFFFFGGALGLGLTCLGLEPALHRTSKMSYNKTEIEYNTLFAKAFHHNKEA